MRDLILSIRADEACHREVNHHFSNVPAWAIIEHEEVRIASSKVLETIENKNEDKLGFGG